MGRLFLLSPKCHLDICVVSPAPLCCHLVHSGGRARPHGHRLLLNRDPLVPNAVPQSPLPPTPTPTATHTTRDSHATLGCSWVGAASPGPPKMSSGEVGSE